MDVVFSEDGRDFTRRDWSSLVTADPAGTFFHTPQYLKLYWEEFAEQPEHLLLAFAEEDGVQVGAVAFERLDGTLRFLGGTEVTDYMGPAALPEVRDAVAKELLAGLGRREDWRIADLRGLAEDQPWLRALADAAAAQGFGVEISEDQNGVAPFLSIPGSYDEYLAGLPSKLRHEIKRKARKLEVEGGPYRVSVAQRDTLEEHLDRFVQLHRTSEGPKGVFMPPGREIFFRRRGEGSCRGGSST
jgi:CelD/BcsL family acetyltransferase involved in cellulose biosynthesis